MLPVVASVEQAVLTEVRVLVKGLWGMETLVQTDSPNKRDRAQFFNAVPFLFANTKMIFDILIFSQFFSAEDFDFMDFSIIFAPKL